MTIGLASKAITAQNVFSDSIAIHGKFNVSIVGISGDTVTVQRSIDNGTTWFDVKSYTANKQESGEEVEMGWLYRIGVKTGDYSAGTILARLSF